MLSFSTNLTNELRDRQASAYWYIKLYHGDESSFTGLSDSDRILDGVKYRGLVLGWGGWQHSANLNDFKPSTAALNNLTISNKDDAIAGGRFSDLFATQNYTNRKFTLHMGAVGVAFADHEQIAQGIITDQAKHNANALTLRLVEDISSVEKEIPTNRVNTTDHTNAPAKNIGKPIPIAFGDFGTVTDSGTVPTSGSEFDRYFVKSKFPAIITDRWSEADANVVCSPDVVELFGLNSKNVFYHGDNNFAACDDSNTVMTKGTPDITFKGETWRAYFKLSAWDTYSAGNYGRTIDDDFSTPYTLTVAGAPGITTGWRIPKIPKLGEFTAVNIMLDMASFSGTPPVSAAGFGFKLVHDTATNIGVTWDGGDQSIDITAAITSAKQDAWDLESDIQLVIDDTGGTNYDQEFIITQVGIEIEFSPSQNFTKLYATPPGRTGRIRWQKLITTEISEYIYYSGKGREFGAWVDADSRDNGYESGDLIENPVYMIEDILRTELELTSAEIGYASFDVAGNTTDGTIKNTFDLAVGSIEFAFCQYKFANAWDFCQELARSCGCLLFFSGDGTIKIVARQKDEDYTSADRTIKFDELENVEPDKTSLAQVRNQVSVNYNMDYAQDVLTETTPAFSDGTSKGSGVQGINATQELIADNRFIIDDTTALAYATVLLDWLKYRKSILDFGVITPKHNDLEIADTIAFSGWPSTFKIYGNDVTATDVFMITKINKTPNGCKITCQKVSEVSD